MQELSVLIVDDEAPARVRLRELLGDLADEQPTRVVGEAGDGLAALDLLERAPADVALVDIRMPKMDGVELAQHLARLPRPPALIFTTAYDVYAVRAFELHAVDYLLKPVRAARLAAALARAKALRPPPAEALQALRPEGRSHLSCHERGRLLLVPIDEVLYLRADLKYVTARTREREYLLDESLTQLEQEFAQRFIRLHRSVLAAKEAIIGFARDGAEDADAHWLALLRDVPEQLPVSRRQWPVVKSYARQLST
ncbi:MAG: response regulator transcription factor [Rhodocyclaceae bacterium]|nr:response regulator transcription factor [Rhodocyclaceae bacterium]